MGLATTGRVRDWAVVRLGGGGRMSMRGHVSFAPGFVNGIADEMSPGNSELTPSQRERLRTWIRSWGQGHQQWRQCPHVRDAADAFALTLIKHVAGSVFNIVGDSRVTVRQIAEMAGGKIEFTPARPGDAKPTWIGNEEAKSGLGWLQKVTFEKGFAELRQFPTSSG